MKWFKQNTGILFLIFSLLVSKAKNSDWHPHTAQKDQKWTETQWLTINSQDYLSILIKPNKQCCCWFISTIIWRRTLRQGIANFQSYILQNHNVTKHFSSLLAVYEWHRNLGTEKNKPFSQAYSFNIKHVWNTIENNLTEFCQILIIESHHFP